MSADAVKNFCKVEVSGYYGTSETSITLKTGEGSKLPSPPFNLVWWNATDYQDPTDDPYREIIRVTAVNGDTLTVSRGQEDTTAQPHNISGKLYKMIRPITAKDYGDLQNIDVYKDGVLIASRPKIDFRGGDVSDDSLNNKVNVFLTGNFAARATNPPSLQLYVSRGQVIIGGVYVFFSGGNSPSFTIPTNYPRIDLLCLNSSGNLEIVQGTESATPSAPTYPADKFVICEVYNRPNEACIKDSNDNTNGYIYKDVRAFDSLSAAVAFKTYSSPSRNFNTTYQNTSGKTLIAIVGVEVYQSTNVQNTYHTYVSGLIGPSSPSIEIARVGTTQSADASYVYHYAARIEGNLVMIVPPGYYYMVQKTIATNGGVNLLFWKEFSL